MSLVEKHVSQEKKKEFKIKVESHTRILQLDINFFFFNLAAPGLSGHAGS